MLLIGWTYPKMLILILKTKPLRRTGTDWISQMLSTIQFCFFSYSSRQPSSFEFVFLTAGRSCDRNDRCKKKLNNSVRYWLVRQYCLAVAYMAWWWCHCMLTDNWIDAKGGCMCSWCALNVVSSGAWLSLFEHNWLCSLLFGVELGPLTACGDPRVPL